MELTTFENKHLIDWWWDVNTCLFDDLILYFIKAVWHWQVILNDLSDFNSHQLPHSITSKPTNQVH